MPIGADFVIVPNEGGLAWWWYTKTSPKPEPLVKSATDLPGVYLPPARPPLFSTVWAAFVISDGRERPAEVPMDRELHHVSIIARLPYAPTENKAAFERAVNVLEDAGAEVSTCSTSAPGAGPEPGKHPAGTVDDNDVVTLVVVVKQRRGMSTAWPELLPGYNLHRTLEGADARLVDVVLKTVTPM